MRKFLTLVGNENKKLRHRKLLWIALAVVLTVSLGFSAIMGLLMQISSSFEDSFSGSIAESLENEISSARKALNNAEATLSEEDRQYQEALILKDELLLAANISSWKDWRYEDYDLCIAYATAKLNGNTALANRLEQMILHNDYIDYYRYKIELIEGANDPETAAAAACGYRFCIENEVAPGESDWRYAAAMEMGNVAVKQVRFKALAQLYPEMYRDSLEDAETSYLLLEYRLENNIPVNPGDSFKLLSALSGIGTGSNSSQLWDTLNITLSMLSVVQIFSIILAAGMVAGEFGKGTVKFLLITPASRWKILLSKYCSLLLNTAMLAGAMFVGNLLFGILFCGGGDFFLPILTVVKGEVQRSSPILLLIGNYLLESVGMLVIVTLAFAISSLFRNTGAAVGISFLVYYVGDTVNSILALVGADWGRYLIFANLNLSNILRGAAYYKDQSLGVAIVILVLHMVVFLWTAFDAFDRREV